MARRQNSTPRRDRAYGVRLDVAREARRKNSTPRRKNSIPRRLGSTPRRQGSAPTAVGFTEPPTPGTRSMARFRALSLRVLRAAGAVNL